MNRRKTPDPFTIRYQQNVTFLDTDRIFRNDDEFPANERRHADGVHFFYFLHSAACVR